MRGILIIMEVLLKSPKYGEFTMVLDEEDFEKHLVGKHLNLSKKRKNMYAYYYDGRKQIFVHKAVMNFTKRTVDHINQDTLNNKKDNLRESTNAQNCSNRGVPDHNTTGFKGVFTCSFNKNRKRFTARITCNRIPISGGCFRTAKQAAIKYNELALKYHGEFACLNIIPEEDSPEDLIIDKPFSSKYRGVLVRGDKIFARIKHKRKNYHLGVYSTEEMAHEAFLKATENKHLPDYESIFIGIREKNKQLKLNTNDNSKTPS